MTKWRIETVDRWCLPRFVEYGHGEMRADHATMTHLATGGRHRLDDRPIPRYGRATDSEWHWYAAGRTHLRAVACSAPLEPPLLRLARADAPAVAVGELRVVGTLPDVPHNARACPARENDGHAGALGTLLEECYQDFRRDLPGTLKAALPVRMFDELGPGIIADIADTAAGLTARTGEGESAAFLRAELLRRLGVAFEHKIPPELHRQLLTHLVETAPLSIV